MYAVIMAGGKGTRLWPVSRSKEPKQLQSLVSRRTLLQETALRLKALIPLNHIFIVTNKTYSSLIRKQIPSLPKKNIIIEPEAKNTAPCIGLAAIHLKKIDSSACMMVLPADHMVGEGREFRRILKLTCRLAQENENLVTLGIKPTYPETGYGYIQIGPEKEEIGENKVFWVKKFIEKPKFNEATRFVKSWNYLWNSGIFTWKVQTILNAYKKYLPCLYRSLLQIEKSLGTSKEKKVLEEEYKKMKDVSVDYGIMERAKKVLVVPADLEWSDLGNWGTLKDVLSKRDKDNVIKGEHIGIDTQGCLVYGGNKPIVTIGVSNLIIVETEDATLICPKEKAHQVKEIVEKLKKDGKDHLL